jgi:hypothetical protein
MLRILQMKLVGTTELVVIAVLIGLISFMPNVLSFIVSSQIGKAAAFAGVAYIWKQHNELIALLLAVALIRACPAYERMTDTEKAVMAASKMKDEKDKKEKDKSM